MTEKLTEFLDGCNTPYVLFSSDWCPPCRIVKQVIKDKEGWHIQNADAITMEDWEAMGLEDRIPQVYTKVEGVWEKVSDTVKFLKELYPATLK